MDPDRDWKGGVLKAPRAEVGPAEMLPKDPIWKSLLAGRVLAGLVLAIGLLTLILVLRGNLE